MRIIATVVHKLTHDEVQSLNESSGNYSCIIKGQEVQFFSCLVHVNAGDYLVEGTHGLEVIPHHLVKEV